MADPALAEAAFDALRARGADRLDPTRWAFVQALAQRTAAWQGPVRQRLQARLASALAAWQAELARAGPAAPNAATTALPAAGAEARSALSALAAWGQDPAHDPAHDPAPAELRTLRRYRRDWARLQAEQRLAGAQAQVPANAGPLHSTGLALRAVQLVRALSPAYLQHLVAHADALLWLEAATGDDALPLPSPVRGGGERRARPRGAPRAGR